MNQTMISVDNVDVDTRNARIMELEGSINHSIRMIDKNKVEIKKKKQELKDRLEADTDYGHVVEMIKNGKKQLVSMRKTIMKADDVCVKLDSDIKSLQADTKDFQLNLTDYLKDLNESTGQMSLTSPEGEIIELEKVLKIKAVKRG